MADLLSTIRAEIDARMRELAPRVAEYERLSSAADALTAEGRAGARRASKSAPATPTSSAASRPASSSSPPAAAPRGTASRKSVRGARRRRGGRGPSSPPSPSGQAILAALEHGSHTIAELTVVTALPASDIRDSLRDLRRRKAIVKTDRDGRSAYALSASGA
jgi:hypothetical protein